MPGQDTFYRGTLKDVKACRLPFYEALGRKKLPPVVPMEQKETPKQDCLITTPERPSFNPLPPPKQRDIPDVCAQTCFNNPGEHRSCASALIEAGIYYKKVDGCTDCAPKCHTR